MLFNISVSYNNVVGCQINVNYILSHMEVNQRYDGSYFLRIDKLIKLFVFTKSQTYHFLAFSEFIDVISYFGFSETEIKCLTSQTKNK